MKNSLLIRATEGTTKSGAAQWLISGAQRKSRLSQATLKNARMAFFNNLLGYEDA